MALVKKQSAIDAIYEEFGYISCDNCEKESRRSLYVCGDCFIQYQNWSISKKIIEKVINSLPPAKSCKDCKNWGKDHICRSLSRFGRFETKADFYCGYAKRKTNTEECKGKEGNDESSNFSKR